MEQDNNQTMNNPATGERTFTQEEVNRIIGERLAKEKAKQEASYVEREQQLAKRELLFNAKERIDKMGLSADLVNVLDVSSPEALDKALQALQETIDKKTSQNASKMIQPNLLEKGEPDYEEPILLQLRKAMKLSG